MLSKSNYVDLIPFTGSRDVHDLLSFLDSVSIRFMTRSISSNKEQINFLAENLDEDAFLWFVREYKGVYLQSVPYEEVVTKLKEYFFFGIDPHQMHIVLSELRQYTSVTEYIDRFEEIRLMLPTKYASEKVLIPFFVAGLKKNTCKELRIRNPQKLREAQKMALEIESLGSYIDNTDGTNVSILKKNNFNALRSKYGDSGHYISRCLKNQNTNTNYSMSWKY